MSELCVKPYSYKKVKGKMYQIYCFKEERHFVENLSEENMIEIVKALNEAFFNGTIHGSLTTLEIMKS